MQRHLFIAIGCIVLFANSLQAATEEPSPPAVKTLVMPFKLGEGIDTGLTDLLTDVAVTNLSEAGNRDVLGQSDITATLDLEAQKQMLGCSDSGCLEELAGAMDVDSLVTGSVDKVGDGFLVILTELDARQVKQLARLQGTSSSDEADLLRTVSRLVEELIVKTSGQIQLFGNVVIETKPSGLTVQIDEKEVGVSPVRLEVPIGIRRVTVIAANTAHTPAEFDMSVYRKQRTTATVNMSVPQVVPDEIMADYEKTKRNHLLFAGAKGCSGACLSIAGFAICCQTPFSLPGYLPLIESIATALFSGNLSSASLLSCAPLAVNFILPVVCCGVGTGGIALFGWAISDALSIPEEPLPDVPQHLVDVTPPEGSPKSYRLPAEEFTMAH